MFQDIPGDDLMQKFARHARDAGVVIIEDIGLAITRDEEKFTITTLTENKYTVKAVIAATGRFPRLSGAPNEVEFLGKSIEVYTTCDGPLYKV